jgi:hypothetical protein
MTKEYPQNLSDMSPDERIDFYSVLFFQSALGLEEYNAMPPEQQRGILEDLLADGDATGTWLVDRAHLVKLLECAALDEGEIREAGRRALGDGDDLSFLDE